MLWYENQYRYVTVSTSAEFYAGGIFGDPLVEISNWIRTTKNVMDAAAIWNEWIKFMTITRQEISVRKMYARCSAVLRLLFAIRTDAARIHSYANFLSGSIVCLFVKFSSVQFLVSFLPSSIVDIQFQRNHLLKLKSVLVVFERRTHEWDHSNPHFYYPA